MLSETLAVAGDFWEWNSVNASRHAGSFEPRYTLVIRNAIFLSVCDYSECVLNTNPLRRLECGMVVSVREILVLLFPK
jgi:hypothetical protein